METQTVAKLSGCGAPRRLLNIDNYKPCITRLLLLLGLADMLHLLTSLLSFSLPTLSSTFLSHTYLHSLPYTLPLAQVT